MPRNLKVRGGTSGSAAWSATAAGKRRVPHVVQNRKRSSSKTARQAAQLATAAPGRGVAAACCTWSVGGAARVGPVRSGPRGSARRAVFLLGRVPCGRRRRWGAAGATSDGAGGAADAAAGAAVAGREALRFLRVPVGRDSASRLRMVTSVPPARRSSTGQLFAAKVTLPTRHAA